MELRTIEIDFEVHKAIELERKSFSESPNEVLRRLLGLSAMSPQLAPKETVGVAWTGKGVTLPHGTELRMKYNGVAYAARIENGKWVTSKGVHSSPSAAAGALAITKSGSTTNLDGWIYWEAKLPGSGRWKKIDEMRRK
jgi:hypothetical protein